MALDAADTIKSTFGSLKTDTGLKIFGLLFVIQFVNLGSSLLTTMGGTAAQALAGVIGLVAAVAMILVTVGAFRSFDSGRVSSEQYTENMFWPVIRLLGANTVTAVFAYGLGILGLLPAIIIAGLTGAGLGAGGLANAGILVGLITLAGLVLGIAAFTYVFLTLTVSVPMVAIEDQRLFQALDRSIQRTRGNKTQMFLAALPVALIYILGTIVILAAGVGGANAGTSNPALLAASALITAFIGTTVFSLLNQYHQRLP